MKIISKSPLFLTDHRISLTSVDILGSNRFYSCSIAFSPSPILHSQDLTKHPASANPDNAYESVANPFLSPIPFSYVRDKAFVLVFFSMTDIYMYNLFSSKVTNNVIINDNYHVFIKVRYCKNSFAMCGNQFVLNYNGTNDIKILRDIVEARLNEFFAIYNVSDEDVVYVQLSFSKLNTKLLSEFALDKKSIDNKSVSETVHKQISDITNIPLSVNEAF